ncbi:MAG: exodeoxyribonuclease V subunit gamma, partial [Pirellulales bacterium]|nr:exodeoxyribonuclease V subunit gamma [Pirellulales bacterium]
EIVIGPARAGKTTALMDRLRRQVVKIQQQGMPFSGMLWIAPTVRAAAAIRDRLLGGSISACLGVSVLTFDQFADRIVRASSQQIRPISRVLQRYLLRQFICDAVRHGQFKHFHAIAETEGFLDLALDFIRDMKRREIWPDEFDAACQRTDWPQRLCARNRELGELYRCYQDLLNTYKLYDMEGRFWVARALMRDGQRQPFNAIRSVFVDGFTDFTRTQHEILVLLAEWIQQLVISFPLEPDPHGQRKDLFEKTLATLSELKRRHDSVILSHQASQATDWPNLEFIGRNLFRPPRQIQESRFEPSQCGSGMMPAYGQTDSEAGDPIHRQGNASEYRQDVPHRKIRVLCCASDIRELEAVAGEIKERIVTGTARPEDILVVARSLLSLAPIIRQVFTEFGIPFSIEARRSISETALVRKLTALLELDRDDWPFRALLSVITGWIPAAQNSSSGPREPVARSAGSGPPTGHGFILSDRVAAERLVRYFQVSHGREILLDCVRGLVRGGESHAHSATGPSGNQIHQHARTALAMLEGLARLLDDLPIAATSTEWIDALANLAGQIGLELVPPDNKTITPFARDTVAAWQQIQSGLVSVERYSSWLGKKTKLDRGSLLTLLRDIASHETLPAEYEDIGSVRILSAPTARAIRAPYLYIIGMREGTFPHVQADDRLLSDAECASLAAAGLPLETRQERYSDEMLLFYEVLLRGEQQITLSYPGLDERASPLLPSPFLQELLRLGRDRIERIDYLEMGPVNRRADPKSPAEFRIRAVADALEGDTSRLAQLFAHGTPGTSCSEDSPPCDPMDYGALHVPEDVWNSGRIWRDTSAVIDASLQWIAERGQSDGFGPAEGVAAWSQTLEALSGEYGANHLWSPSQLEEYAYCPFRFFMERIVKLEPLEELTLDTDFLRRGLLAHMVWAEFHAQLKSQQDRLPLTAQYDRATFCEWFRTILSRHSAVNSSRGVDRALRELDRRQILDWATDYYRQHVEYDQLSEGLEAPFVPEFFEVRFGPAKGKDPGPEDPLSTDMPFELDLDDSTIRITGRVDRIDLGRAAEQVIFNIIDYKTSMAKAVTDEDLENGLRIQSPIYAMAVEELLLKKLHAKAWQADYWWLRKEGYGKREGLSKKSPKVFQLHAINEGKLIPTERWERLRKRVTDRVKQIVIGIRRGAFPVFCADVECTKYCPFRTICHIGHVRALKKQWPMEHPAEER